MASWLYDADPIPGQANGVWGARPLQRP